MNGTITIRRIEQKDIESIMALGQWLITRHDMIAIDPGGPFDLSFVSEIDDRIIGFILAKLEYLGIPLTEVSVIHSIIIDNDYRGQGIGIQLVKELLRHCHGEGIKTVRALVPDNNVELRRFVDNLGFRPSNISNYDIRLDTGKKR